MFERLELLIGNKINLFKNKTVLVIGLGGVGGSAFESLVRSSIQNIIVVDGDKIDITNLNRQTLAWRNTIGKMKTEVAEILAKNINENCQITKISTFLNEQNIDKLFKQKIDFVIDAIDDIKIKKLIIKKCLKEKIKFISVMGAGNKMHPEMLEITDIRKTTYDPIAKIIRKMVKDENIKGKIPVVYSKEKPLITGKIGSNAQTPLTAGLLASSYVINKLLEENNE